MEKTTTGKQSWVTRAFLISLAALILCSVVNWGVITGWGNVRISKVALVGDNNLRYSALLYVPQNATNETPAPGIIMYHGYSGNARNHESWAVEFARRGMVVLAIDYMGGGDGEFLSTIDSNSTPRMFTQYMLNLPFVDATHWVAAGHSAGGDVAVTMALEFNPTVCMASDGGAGRLSKAEGVYNGNLLMLNGTADKQNGVDAYRETTKTIFVRNGVLAEADTIQPNVIYGSFEQGNANMLAEIPDQVHECAVTNKDHIAALLDFTQTALSVPNYISPTDQVWMAKDVVGMIGMFAFVFFMIMTALMMVEHIPFFATVKQPLPRNIGLRKTGLAISIVAAILFPLLCLYTGSFGFTTALSGPGGTAPTTKLFGLHFTTVAMCTVIALNVFGLVMFFVFLFTDGKKHKATIRDLGLTSEGSTSLDFKLIGKSLLVAVLAVAIGWCYLELQTGFLGTDIYSLFFGFKTIPTEKFMSYIPYIIVWIACFAVAAVGMNVERRLPSTGKEWLDTLIAVVFNAVLATFTVSVVVIIQNATQISIGSGTKAFGNWGTDATRIWGMPVGMLIGGAGSTYCYRKTGSIWLGAFLLGIVCALSACLYGQLRY